MTMKELAPDEMRERTVVKRVHNTEDDRETRAFKLLNTVATEAEREALLSEFTDLVEQRLSDEDQHLEQWKDWVIVTRETPVPKALGPGDVN